MRTAKRSTSPLGRACIAFAPRSAANTNRASGSSFEEKPCQKDEANKITPQLHLETSFVLDAAGRIVSTREPQSTSGPVFYMTRSAVSCAWAVRADLADEVADELNRLARE